MNSKNIASIRLINQHIAYPGFNRAEEIVSSMVAMQAQEYGMAKWAIGLRGKGLTEQNVEEAFNEGKILRTHVMRPTWHFVAPADIRWLLKLTAPRINQLSAYYYRRAALDNTVFKRTEKIISKALVNQQYRTRPELQKLFVAAGIEAAGERLSYIMIHAELEGLICSGPRKGKQFTYALLDERVPAVKSISREEALAQFAARYFDTRGPATIQDFAYWSGLTISDAKKGAAALSKSYRSENIEGDEYYYRPSTVENEGKPVTTFLMPDYDEYGMSYKNREALQYSGSAIKGSTVFSHWLVIDGVIRGTWDKKENASSITVTPVITGKLSKTKIAEVGKACKRYERFFFPRKK